MQYNDVSNGLKNDSRTAYYDQHPTGSDIFSKSDTQDLIKRKKAVLSANRRDGSQS